MFNSITCDHHHFLFQLTPVSASCPQRSKDSLNLSDYILNQILYLLLHNLMWSTQLFESIPVVFLQRVFISISTSIANCKLVLHCRLNAIPLRIGIGMVVIVSIVMLLVCIVISSILIVSMLLCCGILKVLFVLILFLDNPVEMKVKKLLIS